jgi:hypothetical protein
MTEETKKIIEALSEYVDDYYSTLAQGCRVLNMMQGYTDADAIAETFNCDLDVAKEVLGSGEVEIDDFETINPENEQHTLYLKIIKIKGNKTYFLN